MQLLPVTECIEKTNGRIVYLNIKVWEGFVDIVGFFCFILFICNFILLGFFSDKRFFKITLKLQKNCKEGTAFPDPLSRFPWKVDLYRNVVIN